MIKLYHDTNSSERTDSPPSYFKKEPDCELNIPQSLIIYTDNKEDTAKQIEVLTSLEPKVKEMMLDITNKHHKKITETGLL